MLILKRRPKQAIWIGDDIRVIMLRDNRIGIEAPEHVNIRREELPPQKPKEQLEKKPAA